MKKKYLFIVFLICILACAHFYKSNKCKDIDYCLNSYFTSGIFNDYKLSSIQNKNTTFSNGTFSVIKIQGLKSKAPHEKKFYNVFLEKNSQGIWKVKKIYSVDK